MIGRKTNIDLTGLREDVKAQVAALEGAFASARVREAALIVSEKHLQDRIAELEKAFAIARDYALEFTAWRKKECDLDTYCQIVRDEEIMFEVLSK